jgi:glycosyltransferase involved in cell wall biosynthesis
MSSTFRRPHSAKSGGRKRLAIVVSHPIQYFTPLYQRLARRDDIEIKVFFTWHAGAHAVEDRGFGQPVAWDIPITEGYESQLIANVSSDAGTHRFFGLRNPSLLGRVLAWQPDLVHITGWAWLSHLQLLRALHRRGVPTLFFGDSHLLDGKTGGPRSWLKNALLHRVYSWPAGVLVVGSANRAYFERFGVPPEKLFACPHSVDVARFADPAGHYEQEAARWRSELGISPEQKVLLFAGKFERKKRPIELMQAVAESENGGLVLVMAGAGELQREVDAIAAAAPARFRVLPFQNQSRMPVIYRMGDVFVLPSAYGETWGLAVNEALACGRPVIVSDRVGCAADVVDSACGRVFPWMDWIGFDASVEELVANPGILLKMRRAASERAWKFDVAVTEAALLAAVNMIRLN